MSLFYRLQGDKIAFFGPGTFQKKEILKSNGARFNGTDKSWVIESSESAIALAKSLGAVGPVGSLETGINARSVLKTPHKIPQTPSSLVDSPDLRLSQTEPQTALQGMTVSQLMSDAQKAVSSAFPNPVWLIGEVQNVTRRSDNLFFEIAETKAGAHATATITVKSNLWGTSYKFLERRHGPQKLADIFVDGTQIRTLVRVTLYKDRGQISVTIEDVDPVFSQGAIALARAELLKKLRSLGLDQKNKSLQLPSFPLRVAFISAEDSRAQTDFEHQLMEFGCFPGTLIFIPCPMQGDRVPKAVVRSLQRAAEANVDLVVISRGGGSAADLRWFDGEEIAMAIAQCPVPVIAAIGHHDDRCVAEEICHTREKTPTAAADFIIELIRSTRTQLNEHAHWLANSLDREITQFTKTLDSFRSRLSDAANLFFQRHKERINYLVTNLTRAFEGMAERQTLSFVHLGAELHQAMNAKVGAAKQQLTATAFELDRNFQMMINKLLERLASLEQGLIR
ncbi:MAG: exodeoxyribonuclease VII large subunit, partial [Proteobacteria bacterium]|nr:exodeoxyribonuclease VII large subunit [Pseudomonadota bacterium]